MASPIKFSMLTIYPYFLLIKPTLTCGRQTNCIKCMIVIAITSDSTNLVIKKSKALEDKLSIILINK